MASGTSGGFTTAQNCYPISHCFGRVLKLGKVRKTYSTMHKTLTKILAVAMITACGSALPLLAQEQPGTAPATTNAPAATHAKHAPFRGTVASVDKTAKTITLEGKKSQVLHVTDQTKITKDDKPATLDDVTAGAKVTGAKQKNGAEWEATSVKIVSTK